MRKPIQILLLLAFTFSCILQAHALVLDVEKSTTCPMMSHQNMDCCHDMASAKVCAGGACISLTAQCLPSPLLLVPLEISSFIQPHIIDFRLVYSPVFNIWRPPAA